VIHVIEGAGGNRDFDGGKLTPRGQGGGLDQEDSATGTFDFGGGMVFPQGPNSWLDTNLTTTQMAPFFPNAGAGQKITMKFRAKVFSFADVVVNGNSLTLYQITEPLTGASSGSVSNPAPFGMNFAGKPLNDPIPDTVLDGATGVITTPAPDGTSDLLDKFTITKPQASISAQLSAPATVVQGGELVYTLELANISSYALNGVQAVVTLPSDVDFTGDLSDSATLQGQNQVVVTVGRLAPGESRTVTVMTEAGEDVSAGTALSASATVRSATAQSVTSNTATTTAIHFVGH
jgi:hypothetical protein